MTGIVYYLRLRMTRLASIHWGVWLVAVVRQVRQDGVEGGGGGGDSSGILSHHQLHFRLRDAS